METITVKKLDEERNPLAEYNDLIRSMPHLTDYQYNVFKAILCLVGDTDDHYDKCIYHLDIKTFRKIFGIGSNTVYDKIKEALLGLQDKKLRKELMRDGKKGFISSPLLGGFKYFEGEAYVEVEIPVYIRQLVVNLRGGCFTRLELEMFAKLKGANTKRLYEILKSWEENRFYGAPLKELKKIMDLESKYDRDNEFLKLVVNPAVKKINAHSDLFIKLNVAGRGGNMRFKFIIKSKAEIEKNEVKKYSFDIDLDNPLNIHIWPRLGITQDLENHYYYKLLKIAEENACNATDPKYYLHYYLCYAENLKKTPDDIIKYITTLLKRDYEGVQFRDASHKIESFIAKQDGRVRNA